MCILVFDHSGMLNNTTKIAKKKIFNFQYRQVEAIYPHILQINLFIYFFVGNHLLQRELNVIIPIRKRLFKELEKCDQLILN